MYLLFTQNVPLFAYRVALTKQHELDCSVT